MHGIRAVMKGTLEGFLAPSRVRTQADSVTWKRTVTRPRWHPNLGLPAPDREKQISVVYRPPSQWYYYSGLNGLRHALYTFL